MPLRKKNSNLFAVGGGIRLILNKSARVRTFEPELREARITHLFVHCSYVRGRETELSDVDIIAEFDSTRKLSLPGRVHLENRLSGILGVKAALADRTKFRPEVMERAELESVFVF